MPCKVYSLILKPAYMLSVIQDELCFENHHHWHKLM